MTTWQSTWRSSLAATALAAMLGSATADDKANKTEEVLVEEAVAAKDDSVKERESQPHKEPIKEALDLKRKLEKQPSASVLEKRRASPEKELTTLQKELAAQVKAQESLQMREQFAARRAKLAQLQENLNRTKEDLVRAQQYLAHSKRLAAKGHITEKQVEADRFAAQKAAAEVAEKEREIHLARNTELQALRNLRFQPSGPDVMHHRRLWETQRNIHHLTQAAENLRAVGRKQLAEELVQEARAAKEKLARELAEHRESAHQPQAADPFRDKVSTQEAPLDQLRREMHDLRGQVNDMRALLERVVDRLESEDRPRDRGSSNGARR